MWKRFFFDLARATLPIVIIEIRTTEFQNTNSRKFFDSTFNLKRSETAVNERSTYTVVQSTNNMGQRPVDDITSNINLEIGVTMSRVEAIESNRLSVMPEEF